MRVLQKNLVADNAYIAANINFNLQKILVNAEEWDFLELKFIPAVSHNVPRYINNNMLLFININMFLVCSVSGD